MISACRDPKRLSRCIVLPGFFFLFTEFVFVWPEAFHTSRWLSLVFFRRYLTFFVVKYIFLFFGPDLIVWDVGSAHSSGAISWLPFGGRGLPPQSVLLLFFFALHFLFFFFSSNAPFTPSDPPFSFVFCFFLLFVKYGSCLWFLFLFCFVSQVRITKKRIFFLVAFSGRITEKKSNKNR